MTARYGTTGANRIPEMTRLPPAVSLAAARRAIVAAGRPVYAAAPGMLLTRAQRNQSEHYLRYWPRRQGCPVTIRWAWCRQDEQGRTETAWLITRRA